MDLCPLWFGQHLQHFQFHLLVKPVYLNCPPAGTQSTTANRQHSAKLNQAEQKKLMIKKEVQALSVMQPQISLLHFSCITYTCNS